MVAPSCFYPLLVFFIFGWHTAGLHTAAFCSEKLGWAWVLLGLEGTSKGERWALHGQTKSDGDKH